jgi:hypothetical protein
MKGIKLTHKSAEVILKSSLESGSNQPKLRVQMLITLLFLFLFFVAIDVITTEWLIRNSPGGIENEINPVGVLLYESFGSAGLIFPKFGLFILFAVMAIYFSTKYSGNKWFIEVTQALILIQVAISLVISFNNFIAILATFYVGGIWPLVYIPANAAILGIYLADLALGAIFANGIMYMWGVTSKQTHLKVFVSLMVFVTPILLFSTGFRTNPWLFAIYVLSASSAVGLFFYITEKKNLNGRRIEFN